MRQKSVYYHQMTIRMYQKATLSQPGTAELFPNIDPESLKNVDTLLELIQRNPGVAVSCDTVNAIMFMTIKKMLEDYVDDVDEYSLKSELNRFFSGRGCAQYQRERATYILTMMFKYQAEVKLSKKKGFDYLPMESLDVLRDRIIRVLEEGLMAQDASPKDNFPRLVEALARETERFPYFMFSERAIDHINIKAKKARDEPSHETSLCC